MYRKKAKEPKELPNCKDCEKCWIGKGEPMKCCSCYYMIIEEWYGWRKKCILHDDWCDELDLADCEDWQKKRKERIMTLIGIDTGVHTGIAYWDTKRQVFDLIKTVKIHTAMSMVKAGVELSQNVTKEPIKIIFEDARQRKWFGNAGREQLQGAGSIKRDCGIWEDFLRDLKCDFEMVAPKNNRTKLNEKMFAKITGYEGRTSEHSRDAAMLVFGRG